MRLGIMGLAAAAAVCAACASASAGVIVSENFDGLTAGTSYNASGQGATGFVSSYWSGGALVFDITAQAATPSGNFLQMEVPLPAGTAYWGLTWGSSWHGNSNNAGTAYALSDVTFSFDARAVGGTGARVTVSDTSNSLRYDFTVNDQWAHYSAPLSAFTQTNGSTYITNGPFMTFSVQMYESNGWGTAAGTRDLQIDNLAISVPDVPIPEPASLGLLGAAGVGLLLKRRR